MRRGFGVVVVLSMAALGAGVGHAATHTVNQVGLTFVPDSLVIEVGDTVEWLWSAGSHTVTSGTGPDDPNVGAVFDDSLNVNFPSVLHSFPEPGDIPYFCRPHHLFGMTGNIRVVSPVPAPEGLEHWSWAGVKGLYR